MKCLFVIHGPKDAHTAVFNNTSARANYLKGLGHEARILSPSDFRGFKKLMSRFLPLVYPFQVACWLMRQRENYDLIVFHSYAGWVFNLICTLMPIHKEAALVVSFHGLEPIYINLLRNESSRSGRPLRLRYRLINEVLMPRLIRFSCRRVDLVTCLNSAEKTYLIEHQWTEEAKITVIANAVDRTFFIERRGWDEPARLLFVGQWLEMKGVRYLVEAFTRLAQQSPQLELMCAGTLASEEAVIDSFPKEVREKVSVRSHLNREELAELYGNSDIFIFPSLSEGASHALLEAMAASLPIVTTPVGFAPDILEDGIDAFLVPICDADGLVKAVRSLLQDSDLREQMGRRAQAKAAHYECSQVMSDYSDLLEMTVAAKRHEIIGREVVNQL
jgi:glycosyltransferase involved in cell wall biosynthesis